MPGLIRKFLVLAAVDGLVLQPAHVKGQKGSSSNAVKVGYRSASGASGEVDIGQYAGSKDMEKDGGKGFEAWGIVGLLSVSTFSYLISITRREQVALIHGKPIYVITEVALTPLSSQKEASASITQTANALKRSADGNLSETDESDDEAEIIPPVIDDVEDEYIVTAEAVTRPGMGHKKTSSVAEDVIAKKGGYGRFAQKWFSKNGWAADRRRQLGLSEAELAGSTAKVDDIVASKPQEDEAPSSDADAKKAESAKVTPRDVTASLLPKLLRTTNLLFGSSRSFFFSYDYDITRSFMHRKQGGSESPLYKDVDPLFFWNRHVIQPFIDAGQAGFVLPLMQGFVGQREFTVELHPVIKDGKDEECIEMTEMPSSPVEDPALIAKAPATPAYSTENSGGSSTLTMVGGPHALKDTRNYLLTLISRRSVKRAGLRYLRRGVDDDGNTANSVETEQILSSTDPSSNSYSFLQLRGSVPVFFSQTPYSFKPVPQMQHSEEINFRAFSNHFSNVISRYGDVQIASLVEKHGNEQLLGEKYEKYVNQLDENGGINGRKIGFEWFDFHAMCRGMKFENVALLIDSLGPALDNFSYSMCIDNRMAQKQSGILRTNCMDCLDRTNVVQSAVGRRALEIQLKVEGISLEAQKDQSTSWFNMLWADNGDAISKQYASTSALKGDFTRTRKRNYKGALTDMGLSISRFYSGIVNDYFSQAAIDFLLGNVTSLVFEDFESNLTTIDPSISTDRMRQNAISISQHIVIADQSEEFISGWALLVPNEPNTIKSTPFSESILLLTDAALYVCRFDWNIDKVSSFERVDLQHIKEIKWGAYVTSTLSAAQADEKRNVGFVVSYQAGVNDISRVNTRSMSTSAPTPERVDSDLLEGEATIPPTTTVSGSILPLSLIVGKEAPKQTKIMAFKALPATTAAAVGRESGEHEISEEQQIKDICDEIERQVSALPTQDGMDAEEDPAADVGADKKPLLVKGDIISLAEARKSTGLLEQLGHSLKKLVWA